MSSPTAGTVFHGSKVPLRKWFWCIYFLSTSKKAVSTLYLKGQLQVNYRTAWCMRQKIQRAMANRDDQYKLGGIVEADEIWIGGAQSLENRRKNGNNKSPFFIAVQENKSGQPMFVTTSELQGVFENHVVEAVEKKIEPKSILRTDGKGSYIQAAVEGDHTLEQSVAMLNRETTREHLKWVNILTSNLKRYLLSTHHGVFKGYRKDYLAEFAYRFNRRFWPEQAFDRLLFANVFTGPTPVRVAGG